MDAARTKTDPRGHHATSPWQMPRRAWKDIAARTYKRTWDDNVGLVAAGVAFYGFFALLSLLGLIVLVYGFVADPMTVIDHVSALTAILPTDVAFIIGDQLMNAVKASQGTKGFGILLAFLVATYGGTNGAASVITALNIAYEEKETRTLFRFYLLAVTMTLAALVVALCAIAATAALARAGGAPRARAPTSRSAKRPIGSRARHRSPCASRPASPTAATPSSWVRICTKATRFWARKLSLASGPRK